MRRQDTILGSEVACASGHAARHETLQLLAQPEGPSIHPDRWRSSTNHSSEGLRASNRRFTVKFSEIQEFGVIYGPKSDLWNRSTPDKSSSTLKPIEELLVCDTKCSSRRQQWNANCKAVDEG